MITQEQIDAAWDAQGGGNAYEAFVNGMRCGSHVENEACADLCLALPLPSEYSGMQKWAWERGAEECAAAIRARGATDGKPT